MWTSDASAANVRHLVVGPASVGDLAPLASVARDTHQPFEKPEAEAARNRRFDPVATTVVPRGEVGAHLPAAYARAHARVSALLARPVSSSRLQ